MTNLATTNLFDRSMTAADHRAEAMRAAKDRVCAALAALPSSIVADLATLAATEEADLSAILEGDASFPGYDWDTVADIMKEAAKVDRAKPAPFGALQSAMGVA